MSDDNIYWGETHHNIFVKDNTAVDVSRVMASARDHLDFMAIAYYTPALLPYKPEETPAGKTGFRLESWKTQERLAREWPQVQEATKRHNEDGRFVTFPGYEWQGNSTSGDHNVVFRAEGGEIYCVDTLAELYDRLRGQAVIAIPHHTAYRAGMRGKDWDVHDEDLSPFAELFSVHGCSETDEGWIGLWQNHHMGPGLPQGTYQAALNRGLHVGAICSGDNFGHGMLSGTYGHGLMAVMAPALTRDALWQAFKARRVYGVTGDRIALRFTVNDQPLGACIQSDGERSIRVEVCGLDALDRIEILRGDQVLHTHNHQGTWRPPEARSRFCVRLEAGWGPTSSEIEAQYHDWQGEVTIQGGRFLRAVPCWRNKGQTPPVLADTRVTFGFHTPPMDHPAPWQNANVFEIEAEPASVLHLALNGRKEQATMAELMAASRLLWYRDECIAALQQQRGLTPEECERDDTYFHLAHKAKLHRAIPEAGYTATVEVTDDEPLEHETHYRVRVEQRNGQRAWSSPIWVRPG